MAAFAGFPSVATRGTRRLVPVWMFQWCGAAAYTASAARKRWTTLAVQACFEMEGLLARQNRKKLKLKVKSRAELIKKTSEIFINNYNRKTLKRATKWLVKKSRKRKKKTVKDCYRPEKAFEARVDDQVKLRCRQLPNVVNELRKSVMRQDWNESATLLMILCHPGLKLYRSIIVKTCFILLFCHPSSNLELLQNFVRLTTGYILEEDIIKFTKILFALRKSALSPLESGKYIRKSGDYKVTRDPEFEKLL